MMLLSQWQKSLLLIVVLKNLYNYLKLLRQLIYTKTYITDVDICLFIYTEINITDLDVWFFINTIVFKR